MGLQDGSCVGAPVPRRNDLHGDRGRARFIGFTDESDLLGDGARVFDRSAGGFDAGRGKGEGDRFSGGGAAPGRGGRGGGGLGAGGGKGEGGRFGGGGVELAAGEGEDGFEAGVGFGAIGEKGIDQGPLDFQGRGEEAVSQEGVGVAASVASLFGDRPAQGQLSFAGVEGRPGGGSEGAEGEGPVGAGESLMAGEGGDGGSGPVPGGIETEGVSQGEGGVVPRPDDFEGISVFGPEAEVLVVGSLEVLPDGSGGIEGDVHGGAREGGGGGGLP